MVKMELKIESESSKPIPSSSSSSSSSIKTSSKSKSSCKKQYKGVRMRSWGSWVSEIRAPNQKTRIWLGSYSTAEAAARAYDAALLCLKGASANLNLNFPISSYSQHFPESITMSPKSIQRVAAAAAVSTISTITTNPESQDLPYPPSISSYSASESTSSLSPSLSSLPADPHVIEEDDLSLAPSANSYLPNTLDETMPLNVNQWYNFDSPKYTDMLNGVFFDPMMNVEDVYEDGDISLWSFC